MSFDPDNIFYFLNQFNEYCIIFKKINQNQNYQKINEE